jgi:DNA-binding protein HU-beta
MTKADIVNEISEKTGVEKLLVQTIVESTMKVIKTNMVDGKNVYLRGFGTFVVKKRAEKLGRNISKNTTVVIPAHFVPAFKPAKTFSERVKKNVKVAEPDTDSHNM